MNKLIYILFFLANVFVSNARALNTASQTLQPLTENATEPEMADAFRSDGKIYVVITVLAIIFLCIIGYLIYIDVKLKKLENRTKEKV